MSELFIWFRESQKELAKTVLPKLSLVMSSPSNLYCIRFSDVRFSVLHKLIYYSDLITVLQAEHGLAILYGFNDEGQRTAIHLKPPTGMSYEFYADMFSYQITDKQFELLNKHQLMNVVDPDSL